MAKYHIFTGNSVKTDKPGIRCNEYMYGRKIVWITEGSKAARKIKRKE